MKKILFALLAAVLLLSVSISGCSDNETGNFTDEMKIPHAADLSPEDGADSIERDGDHPNSPYFKHPDFYNMTDTDTLTILSKFKTQQQTSEWSCGVTVAVMVLDWYNSLGDHNELTLSEFRKPSEYSARLPGGSAPSATSLRQMIDMFEAAGEFDIFSTFDCIDDAEDVFTLNFIQETLKEGHPVIIGWNDWGGHWQAIIGYDTMGTEEEGDDVIIVADPYDSTDHNQDGYVIYGAERILYNFTFYNFFPEEELNDTVFMVVKPK